MEISHLSILYKKHWPKMTNMLKLAFSRTCLKADCSSSYTSDNSSNCLVLFFNGSNLWLFSFTPFNKDKSYHEWEQVSRWVKGRTIPPMFFVNKKIWGKILQSTVPNVTLNNSQGGVRPPNHVCLLICFSKRIFQNSLPDCCRHNIIVVRKVKNNISFKEWFNR